MTHGQLVRRYTLTYKTSASTGRSLVTSVTQTGSDNSTALPPITFDWQQISTPTGAPALKPRLDIPSLELVDLNNDGFPDGFLDANPGNQDGSSIALNVTLNNQANGWQSTATWGYRTLPYGGASKFKSWALVDVDGDHLRDFVYYDWNGGVHVLKNTGSGFSSDPGPCAFVGTDDVQSWVMADFNGDGRADLLYETGDYYTRTIYVLPGNANGSLGPAVQWGTRGTPNFPLLGLSLADFNNDGMMDIVYDDGVCHYKVLLSTGGGFAPEAYWGEHPCRDYTYPAELQVGDVNGDGLPDLVIKSVATISLAINTGAAFLPETPTGTYVLDYAAWSVMDFNNDGMADIVVPWYTYIESGGFSEPSAVDYLYFPSTGSGFLNSVLLLSGSNWTQMMLQTDSNADGLPDITTDFVVSLFRSKGPAPDLITTINNGVGGSHSIAYRASSAYQNTYLPYVLQTVASITTNSGWPDENSVSNISTTSYTYSGGLHNVPQREFRGFSYMKQTLPNGSTVESYFQQGGVTKGLMYVSAR